MQSCGQPTRGIRPDSIINEMTSRAFPPNFLEICRRVAERNALSVDFLLEKNEVLSTLTWKVIQIFELNFCHFLDQKISIYTPNPRWQEQDSLIFPKHKQRLPKDPDSHESLGLGFLCLLFSDRYHSKLWVPCLSIALPHWKLPRRNLHQEFLSLLIVRNRIAHHEIIYNYPLIELSDFAQQIMLDVNSEAAKTIKEMKIAEKIQAIKLGSGGGI